MASLSQSLRYLQVETSLGKDVLILTQASGHERLGGLFEISIEFTKQSGDLDLDGLLGTSATLGIHNAAESRKGSVAHSRYFNGYFSRIAFAGYGGEGQARFQATMVPWLWFLTRTADCRIFQQKSVPDILEEVFRDAGFSDFKKDLRGSYQPRDFCVQYRETDFNFVSRLMESEGIYYYFEHQNGSHKMVLCDDMVCHKKDSKHETIKFIGGADARDTKGVITDWSFAKQVKPGKFAHNEFNFKTPTPDPNLRLLARASAPKPQKPAPFEIYDNLGGYETIGEGNRYARLRMEEIISDRDTAQARTNIIGIKCGCKFKLDKHPISDQNKEYLITSVHWSAAEGGYGSGSGGGNFFDCDFSSIPAASTYRPLRVTPLPKIEGPQTATVCGPSGQEIYVDKHARVKVQFHWDRYGKSDAGSSCWIRVSQPWAGGAFGGMAIPRIGHEVIVEFIEADPDRPIITGRVFNGHNQPFASNAGRDGKPGNVKPKDITQAAMMTSIKSNSLGKTGGSNEITMNDMSGKEGLFIKAQKDEIHKVGNDREDEVGNDEKRKVKNNRTREVGVNEKILIGSNQNVQIKGSSSTSVAGSRSVSVGGAGSLSIGKDYKESVGKNYSVKATNKYELKAREIGMEADMKMSAKAMKSTLEGKVSCSVLGSMITLKGNTIVLKAGGSSILLTPTCIMIDAPMLLLNSGGAPVQALAAGALSGFALAMAAMGQLGMIAAGAGMAVAALAGRGIKSVAQKVTSLTGRLFDKVSYSADKFMGMAKQAAKSMPSLGEMVKGGAKAALAVGLAGPVGILAAPTIGLLRGIEGRISDAYLKKPITVATPALTQQIIERSEPYRALATERSHTESRLSVVNDQLKSADANSNKGNSPIDFEMLQAERSALEVQSALIDSKMAKFKNAVEQQHAEASISYNGCGPAARDIKTGLQWAGVQYGVNGIATAPEFNQSCNIHDVSFGSYGFQKEMANQELRANLNQQASAPHEFTDDLVSGPVPKSVSADIVANVVDEKSDAAYEAAQADSMKRVEELYGEPLPKMKPIVDDDIGENLI